MPLAFVRGIHRWLVNSPHKGPVAWKMFPFDDVIIVSFFVNLWIVYYSRAAVYRALMVCTEMSSVFYTVICHGNLMRFVWELPYFEHDMSIYLDCLLEVLWFVWLHGQQMGVLETKPYGTKDGGWTGMACKQLGKKQGENYGRINIVPKSGTFGFSNLWILHHLHKFTQILGELM